MITAAGTVNTVGPSGLISRHASASSTFYQFDSQGNVCDRLNSDGGNMWSGQTDPFGNVDTAPPSGDPFGYEGQAGYYTDQSSGLVLCTYRYYDPSAGRWLNRDPIGYAGGTNLYGYVGNDPVGGIDPEGTDDGDNILPQGQSGGTDTVGSLTSSIHQLSGYGQQAGLVVASLNPEANAVEAVSGQDAAGHHVSAWDRFWSGVSAGFGVSEIGAAAVISSTVRGMSKTGTVAHHIFPQASEFSRFWAKNGMDIEKFKLRIPENVHLSMHGYRGGEWNASWREFFSQSPDADFKKISDFAHSLMSKYGIENCPWDK